MADHSMVFELFYGGAWNAAPVYVRDGCVLMRGVKGPGDSDPAAAAVTLDNRAGLYSPRSIVSPLHGLIGLNTQARITADGGVRLTGEVAKWMPGRAIAGDAWTKLEVAGLLQRIGRGTDPLQSAIQRAVMLGGLNPATYEPMRDGSGATSVTDLTRNSAGLAVLGTPQMASVPGPGAGDTLHPELVGPGGYIGGFRGTVPVATAGEWAVEFSYRAVASASNAQAVVAQWRTTGTFGAYSWLVYVAKIAGVHYVVLVGQHDTGSATAINRSGVPLVDGRSHRVRVTAKQNTATQIHVDLIVDDYPPTGSNLSPWVDGVGSLLDFEVGDYTGFLNVLYTFANVESLSVSDVVTWSTSTPPDTYEASTGYLGETAADRFSRLCAENDISSTVVGVAAESVTMGPQRLLTLLETYDELARTDDASIFETRGSVGLTMRTGASKLNQLPDATVSYLGQVAPGLEPVYGDEGVRNDVTAVSPAGSFRQVEQLTGPRNVQLPAVDPEGVGRYATRLEVNPATDDALAYAAGWRVGQGTFDGTWYARVTVDIDADPAIAAAAAALDIGDVLALSNLPVDEALDVVESVIIGIEESILPKRRLITFYLVPAAPYRVGVLATTSGDTDPFVGHLDTDDSTTVGSTAPGAATFSVATNSGPLWTTFADDFPFDVIVGGQRVSISSIAGGASPQTFTVQVGGLPVVYQIPAGSSVTVQQPVILAL